MGGSGETLFSQESYDKVTDKMSIYILQAISLFIIKLMPVQDRTLNIYQNVFEPMYVFRQSMVWYVRHTNTGISKLENLRNGFG